MFNKVMQTDVFLPGVCYNRDPNRERRRKGLNRMASKQRDEQKRSASIARLRAAAEHRRKFVMYGEQCACEEFDVKQTAYRCEHCPKRKE